MQVFLQLENGDEEKIADATLVEQNIERTYIENERVNYSERHQDAALIRVKGCETIGYVSNGSAELIEGGVSEAEQETDETVRIMYEDGTEETVEGELDRAYTY